MARVEMDTSITKARTGSLHTSVSDGDEEK